MACEGNGMSDARIGEALIKEVIEEELKEAPSEDIPPLAPLAVMTEQERKVVIQLNKMIRIIGDMVRDDKEFQDAIEGMACSSGASWDRFKKVAETVFEHGITWERIAVLFYIAGRLAVRMVQAHLFQSVRDIHRWTVTFFRTNLLEWIQERGGWMVQAHLFQSVRDIHRWTVTFFRTNLLEWIQERERWMNAFSGLAVASMQSVSSLSSNSYGLVVIFITGLALGNVITWGLTIQP